MRRFIRTQILLALCLFPLLAACGKEKGEEASPAAPIAVTKPTAVRIALVAPQDVTEQITLPGSLEAWQDLTLAAEIAGPVDWVGPREGEALSAGQKIMTIDSVSQQANLERDRVNAENDRKTMQRLTDLAAKHLISQQEYDNSATAYATSQQALELARIALRKSTVLSPVAGILDARFVERGEYIKAGDPVAVVVQIDRLKALIAVPEKDVRYFQIGEEVSVIQTQIDTGAELRRSGKLVHLAYKADPQTRTYLGKIEVDNRDRQLRPGMIVRIEALRRELKGAIAIPLYAVVDLDGRKVVFVEEGGKALLRVVTIDRVVGDQAVLSEGLQADERLIVKGQQLLADGAAVAVEDK